MKIKEIKSLLELACIEVYETFKNNHESFAMETSHPQHACELLCSLDVDCEVSPVDKVSLIIYV